MVAWDGDVVDTKLQISLLADRILRKSFAISITGLIDFPLVYALLIV